MLCVPEKENDARGGYAEKPEPVDVEQDFDEEERSDECEKQNACTGERRIILLTPAPPKGERIDDREKKVDCEVLGELGECMEGERRRKPQGSTFQRRQHGGVAHKADLKVPELPEADGCEGRRSQEKPCDDAGEEQKGFLL